MDDFGKPKDGFVEPIIEAMDKDKHLAASALFGGHRQCIDK